MKIIGQTGVDNIATLYAAEFGPGKCVEFAESVHPPRHNVIEKLVYIVSTLYGCPVGCKFCDAGGFYSGKLSVEEIFRQIDYMAEKRFGSRKITVNRFKVQFARMGEPAFNDAVLEALEQFGQRYECGHFIPSLSTIAPCGAENFFTRLLSIKKRLYDKTFQLQFSIHSTAPAYRDWLMPAAKLPFESIAAYGNEFFSAGGKKITLNFALAPDAEVSAEKLKSHFRPDRFLIKITPVNPTCKAAENKIVSYVKGETVRYPVQDELEKAGYQVLISVGDLAENAIGSNCGQYLSNLRG